MNLKSHFHLLTFALLLSSPLVIKTAAEEEPEDMRFEASYETPNVFNSANFPKMYAIIDEIEETKDVFFLGQEPHEQLVCTIDFTRLQPWSWAIPINNLFPQSARQAVMLDSSLTNHLQSLDIHDLQSKRLIPLVGAIQIIESTKWKNDTQRAIENHVAPKLKPLKELIQWANNKRKTYQSPQHKQLAEIASALQRQVQQLQSLPGVNDFIHLQQSTQELAAQKELLSEQVALLKQQSAQLKEQLESQQTTFNSSEKTLKEMQRGIERATAVIKESDRKAQERSEDLQSIAQKIITAEMNKYTRSHEETVNALREQNQQLTKRVEILEHRRFSRFHQMPPCFYSMVRQLSPQAHAIPKFSTMLASARR